jgi:hypothetical protein
MKTPMQRLFAELSKDYPDLFSTNTKQGREFINKYYVFLKQERSHGVDLLDLDLKLFEPKPITGMDYWIERQGNISNH